MKQLLLFVFMTSVAWTHVHAQCAQGNPSVFGDNVWNVYAWNAGGATITAQSWSSNYSGYYTDTALNLDTRNKWGTLLSPSSAPGYLGCAVNVDNHSWSAKRQGFSCGHYRISIAGHDDAGQLFVDGVKVWEHIGCCDSHSDIWEGDLGATSRIEFRVTEGTGGSFGAISFTYVSAILTPVISSSTACGASDVTLTSSSPAGNQWLLEGNAINGATSQTYAATVSGNYSVQVTYGGCTGISAAVPISIISAGDPTVFGNNVWNVYAWNAGDAADTTQSWKINYSGYYIDSTLNLDTRNNWNDLSSPSAAPGYIGCSVGIDHHSWSAKRQGFPCGHYKITIEGHDDEAQLFIDGVNVWQHLGCCDTHPDVWEGDLRPDSKIEFRGADGDGGSFGAISINYISANPAAPLISTNTPNCNVNTALISSNSTSNNQWFYNSNPIDGATSQTYTATVSGIYSLAVTSGGCTTPSAPLGATIVSPIDPSVFGNHVWNVYAWNAGDESDTGRSWTANYSGYYADSGLNLDTRNKWGELTSPSSAAGYIGCSIGIDHHSWSAKRQGFTCGHYKISVAYHDDEGQLFIDGVKVWEHIGSGDAHPDVWEGQLGPDSKIEFRCTEGVGASSGAITFNYVSANPEIQSGYTCGVSSILLTSSSAHGNQWFLNGAAIDTATSQTYIATVSGHYSVKVTAGGCTATSASISLTLGLTDPSVFGNNMWNVYAWNAGDAFDTTQSWKANYSGYYTDTTLNLDTRNKWGIFNSPSDAPGYIGCPVNADHHSWSAKRQGFSCGHYKISITGHDDAGKLFIDGAEVWEHIGCCDSHDNVWEGDLGPNSKIEFRVTEGTGGSLGAISFNRVSAYPAVPTISSNGTTNCNGGNILLTSSSVSANQWFLNGNSIDNATSQTYTATASGSYMVKVTSGGCTSSSAPASLLIGSVGDPTVFGSNVWNVYAWNAGGAVNNGQSWDSAYKGYYVDTALNFATTSKWNANSSPSSAPGYLGCPVNIDNHSWSAKRQGFPCGHYTISITGHDDASQLLVDGVKVWEHVGCCDAHPNVWEGSLGPNSKIEFRTTEGGGASFGSLVFNRILPLITADGATSFCQGGNVTLVSNLSVGNQWYKDSIAINDATAQTYVATASGNYSVGITGATGCMPGFSSVKTVTVSAQGPPGDTSEFGNNIWNVYIWNSGNGTLTGSQPWSRNYSGYYTDTTTLSFDTRNKWNENGAPSNADNYQGCSVDTDNHSWSAKRQGFPCGRYQVNVTSHDDAAQLFIDGIKVWEHNGCCDVHNNVWTGSLDADSRIEFRGTDGLEASKGALTITAVAPVITANSYTTFCPGQSIVLSASTGSSYLWSTGETTKDITVSESGDYSVQVTYSCGNHQQSAPITITVQPLIPAVAQISYSDACGGYSFLSETGYPSYGQGYSFTWYRVGEVNAVSSAAGFYTYTSGDYYVIVSRNGCSGLPSDTITVNVPSKGDPSVFGDNQWNVYYWQDYNYYEYDPDYEYQGYYTEPLLSFDTRNRWNEWGAPYDADNYVGCYSDADAFLCSAKRKGFPCGHYRINIPAHNDWAELWVNGVKVWNHQDCCDSHTNVWEGDLGPNSTVEFKVTELWDQAYGAIDFELVDSNVVTKPTITPSGPIDICSLDNITLTSSSSINNLWSTGDITQSIVVNTAGNYSVTVTGNQGCTAQSDPVDVTVSAAQTWYADGDKDGFGNEAISTHACTPPSGYVSDSTDCNDNDATVHSPLQYYVDADHDGYGSSVTAMVCASTPPIGYSTNSSDCDDTRAFVHPGAPEICGNGIDDNCDGRIDEKCARVDISINDVSAIEKNKGTSVMTFIVGLNKISSNTVTVHYSTQNVTATAGSDYLASSGVITFAPGIKKQNVKITINGDKTIEPNETFNVVLNSPVNANIIKAAGVGTIVNDDGTVAAVAEVTLPDNKRVLTLMPNPVSNVVTINLEGYTGNVTIQLGNSEGKLLKQEKLTAIDKFAQQQMDVSRYANGIYFVTAIDEKGNRQTEKLVVQR